MSLELRGNPAEQYYFKVKGGEFVNEGKMVNEFTARTRGSERWRRFHKITLLNATPVIAGVGTVGLIILRILGVK